MRLAGILSFLLCFIVLSVNGQQRPQPDQIATEESSLMVQPIQHGTLVLGWDNQLIYVDPTGGSEAFEGISAPSLIMITHAHGDHMSIETLKALNTKDIKIVVPQSVADELPDEFSNQLVVLGNGETTNQLGFTVKAVPMYNLPESDETYHPKGWGNGYVMTLGGKKVYISGDTEDIKEMRSLKDIDVAFVCMNLPYTMKPEQAADAVLDFKPAIVYPYHYRGQDTEKFKRLVTDKNEQIDVRLRDWYMGK